MVISIPYLDLHLFRAENCKIRGGRASACLGASCSADGRTSRPPPPPSRPPLPLLHEPLRRRHVRNTAVITPGGLTSGPHGPGEHYCPAGPPSGAGTAGATPQFCTVLQQVLHYHGYSLGRTESAAGRRAPDQGKMICFHSVPLVGVSFIEGGGGAGVQGYNFSDGEARLSEPGPPAL